MLGTHIPEEAIFGSLIGGLCVAVFFVGTTRLRECLLQLPIWLLFVLSVGSMSVWSIGHRADPEEIIGQRGIEIGSVLGIS